MQWEYKVGPLTVNFRVLAEPKGFLRIVLFVSCLLDCNIEGRRQGKNGKLLAPYDMRS